MLSIKQTILILLILFAKVSVASVSHDLEQVFNGLGTGGNITKPQHVDGQRAGFYTGGSVFMRQPVRNYTLAHVQLPDVSAGCGGINLFTGGFSFINADELKNAIRDIPAKAPSYAFLLGLETVSPLMKNQMMELQKMANEVNRLNINSCQTTSLLVGSLWPKAEEASRQICENISTMQNKYADRVKARHNCANHDERRKIMVAGKKDPAWKDVIPDDTNLAWQLLQKNSYFAADNELAEFLMSLSGSLIYTTDKPPIILPSLLDNPTLLKALLEGGPVTLYHCDNTICLNPTKRTVTINPQSGFQSQVDAMLTGLLERIQSDTSLSPNEIGFLESVSLPVYKMLNVESAFYGGSGVLNLTDYSDVIALDLLFTYLNDNLTILTNSQSVLAYPKDMIDEYRAMLMRAKQTVNQKRQVLLQTKTVNTALIEKTRLLEKMLAGQLTADLTQDRRQ